MMPFDRTTPLLTLLVFFISFDLSNAFAGGDLFGGGGKSAKGKGLKEKEEDFEFSDILPDPVDVFSEIASGLGDAFNGGGPTLEDPMPEEQDGETGEGAADGVQVDAANEDGDSGGTLGVVVDLFADLLAGTGDDSDTSTTSTTSTTNGGGTRKKRNLLRGVRK